MYETNKRQMNYESLCILADFYCVSTDYLLGREAQDMILLFETEKEIIAKYRELDERGKQNIIGILEIEYSLRQLQSKFQKGVFLLLFTPILSRYTAQIQARNCSPYFLSYAP